VTQTLAGRILGSVVLRWFIALALVQANLLGGFLGAGVEAAPTTSSAQEKWLLVDLGGQTIRSLAAAPSNPQQVYVAVDGPSTRGVYSSSDGGRTWANLGLGEQRVFAVAVCPSGTVFAGTWGGGVFRLSGGSWNSSNVGLGSLWVNLVACDDSGALYAGTNAGLFKSVNAAADWFRASSGLPSGYVLAMAWRQGALFAGTQDGVFRSSDGGGTWGRWGLVGQGINDLELDPADPQRMWAASGTQGVQFSPDGGGAWQAMGSPTDSITVAHDAIGDLVVGTLNNGVYRFDGAGWVPQQLNASRVYRIRRVGSGAGHLLAGTANGIWTPLPDLRLSMRSLAPNGATVGAEMTYFVDYRTTGNGIISGVVITNEIPVGTDLVPNSIQPPGIGSVSGRVVRWNLGNLGPDPVGGTVSYKVWVNWPPGSRAASVPGSGNPMPIVSEGALPQREPALPALPAVEDAAEVGGQPAMSEDVSSPPPAGRAGRAAAPAAAALTLTKTANPTIFAMTGSVITYTLVAANTGDVVLTGVTVSDPLLGALTCTWPGTPGTLNLGQSVSCIGTHTTTVPDAVAGSFQNTASANSGQAGPVTASATIQYAHLRLTKTANPTTFKAAGNIINYTIVATNNGQAVLTGVAVSDPILGALTCTWPGTAGTLNAAQSVSCTGRRTISAADVVAGSVRNTATVTSAQANADTASATVRYAHLTLTKTANPTTFKATGNVINYTLVAANDGQAPLTGVAVTDPALGALSCTWPGTAGTLNAGQTVSCSGAHTISVTDAINGSFQNTATVISGQTDPVTASATVRYAHLRLTKTADPITFNAAGNVINYTIVANNNGQAVLTGVAVSDPTLGALTCAWPGAAGTLNPAQSVSCTGSYTISPADVVAGSVRNTATVTSAQANPDTASATVSYFRLMLTKSAQEQTYSAAGQTLHYTIVATNGADVTLTGVSISDTQLNSLSCTPSQPATLAPGAALSCSGTYVTTQADVDSGSVVNTASVTASLAGTIVSQSASKTINATQTLDLRLVKSTNGADANVPPGPYILPGYAVQWTYNVINAGNVVLSNLVVTDDKGLTVTCPVTTLAPGSETTCSASGVAATGQYINKGTATAKSPLGESLTDVDMSHYFGVTTGISLVKTVYIGHDGGAACPGQSSLSESRGVPITYCFRVTNNGNAPLRQVSVKDPALGINLAYPLALAPGASTTLHFETLLAGDLANTATASGTPSDPSGNPVPGAAPPTATGQATVHEIAPDLSILKTHAATTAKPGETLLFTLSYGNTGTDSATGVRITETVPARTTFRAQDSSPGWSCADGAASGTVCTMAVGSVPAGWTSIDKPFPQPSPWHGEYFANPSLTGSPALVRDDAAIDFDWGSGSPAPQIPSNNFSVRWTGTVTVAAGRFRFSTTTDDGVRLYVDGQLVIDQWRDQPPTTYNAERYLSAGQHTMRMEYYEGLGLASARLITQERQTFGFAVRVDSWVPAALTKIANSAQIGDDGKNGPDLTPGNNSTSDQAPITTAGPRLALQKLVSNAAVPGGALAYSLATTNTGDREALGVTLRETVPVHTRFSAAASTAGWSCSDGAAAGATCNFALGSLNGGGAKATTYFAVTVDFPLALGTPIVNIASVTDSLGNTSQASDSTQIAPGPARVIVNPGAHAIWQFAGSQYAGASAPLVYNMAIFLPVISNTQSEGR
jgi:uncharacterized repeat protein (TIGR01451 family)